MLKRIFVSETTTECIHVQGLVKHKMGVKICSVALFITVCLKFGFIQASGLRIGYNTDSEMPLDKLKHVFDSPNCSDSNIICKILLPENIYSFLQNQTSKNIQRLCIFIRAPTSSYTANLLPLSHLESLRQFWILPEHLYGSTVSSIYTVALQFPENALLDNLTGLFIHVPLRLDGSETLGNFVENLQNLQILSLRHTANINRKKVLQRTLQKLEGKPLTALSLKHFQEISDYGPKFLQILNATDFLWPLRECPLQYLDLSDNAILQILPGIFSVTKGLRIIDISDNNMVHSANKPLWIELLLHPSLEVVNVRNQGCPEGLKHDTISKPSEDNIKYSYTDSLQKCLQKLNITSRKQLEIKKIFCQLLYCFESRYLQGIPCEVLPSYQDLHLDFSCLLMIAIPVGRKLKEIHADDLKIQGSSYPEESQSFLCVGENSLEVLSFANNAKLMYDLAVDESVKHIKVKGLNTVEHLDFSNNHINMPLESVLSNSTMSVKKLFLSGNFIQPENSDICHSLELLQVLDLSNNNLTRLPLQFVEKCQKLESLDVSRNAISDVYTEFNINSRLKLLNASNNRMARLSVNALKVLKSMASDDTLEVDLSGNPWTCECSEESLNTIKFIQAAEMYNLSLYQVTEYGCYLKGKYVHLLDVNVKNFQVECFGTKTRLIVETVLITLSFIVFCMLMYLCYKFRYRINTCYLHTCLKIHKLPKSEEQKIKFDAFVSYAADDRFWVHDVLMPELENNYGFHLCLHYRDFPVCGDIADVIVEHIQKSRSIVVILSEYSIKRPWCEFELKAAHTQHLLLQKPLIIIKLGKIKTNDVDSDFVKDLLNSQVYIEWPDGGIKPSKNQQKTQRVFWGKVEKAIYGEDFCGCFRYCNPFHNSNDPLRSALLDKTA